MNHSLVKKQKLFKLNADFKHDIITIAMFFGSYIAALLFIFSLILLCLPKLNLLDLNHSDKIISISTIIFSLILFYASYLGYKNNKKNETKILESFKKEIT